MALIAIQGYYGYGNLGDDLMLYLLLEQLRQSHPETRFRILLHADADGTLVEFPAGATVETRVVRTWRERLDALEDADLLVFGGGTCLHRLGFCGLYNNLAARWLGVPVIWLGVGADDVGRGKTRWKAKLSLATCSEASWRDMPSQALAARLSSRFRDSLVAEDLAFGLPHSPTLAQHCQRVDDPNGVLVVGWRCLSSYLSADAEAVVLRRGAASIANAAKSHRRVEVIDIADLVDNEQNAKLAAQLRDLGVQAVHREGLSMQEKLSAIQQASGGIFARLHGLVLAQMFGVPSVAVGYASKLENFSRLFHDPPIVSLQQLQFGDDMLGSAYQRQRQRPTMWREPVEQHTARALQHIELVRRRLGAVLQEDGESVTRSVA